MAVRAEREDGTVRVQCRECLQSASLALASFRALTEDLNSFLAVHRHAELA